ncbi:MAG: type I-U CRISPR-associated helicase/endonuclease Cas3 [Labilithrix sp.]
MADLSIDHFADFFEAVHGPGKRPFPWQERLLRDITQHPEGRWPDLLDLPTGSGKTAAIDVAVFHLALEAAKPRSEMRAPRRIVLVVDRRTVVDQAFARGRSIADRLLAPEATVLRAVRDRLTTLSSDTVATNVHPLECVQLRGGIPRDDSWARSPTQPLVAVSTVDQVGSRVLFRGYGVSDTMRPIHAGLLGNDTLFLLDEVHLARPFMETLEAIGGYRAWSGPKAAPHLPNRWQVVPMSATANRRAGVSFSLAKDDRDHPVLQRRLRASKPIMCEEVKVSGAEAVRRRQFAESAARHAVEQATGSRAVAVVVNRVATALEVFGLVREAFEKKKASATVEIVTGRMRPLDRDALDRRLSKQVGAGRERDAAAEPFVVVATQCIEAGADFDFDFLVTECASLDALRQRFGRLNRLGDVDGPTPGVVLARSDSLTDKASDPIYGDALKKTWAWLSDKLPDFGIEAFDAAAAALSPEERVAMLPRPAGAPVMLPAHLDAWAQTSQIPSADPEISFWLHGKDQRVDADVQLVWRADIEAPLTHVAQVGATPQALEALQTRIEICAPCGLEALSVPIQAAREWLASTPAPGIRSEAADFGDVDGVTASRDDGRNERPLGRPAFAWQGDESRLVYSPDLKPGMTIVVPSSYGGLLSGTWDPASGAAVPDLGDQARWTQSRRPVFRLHSAVRSYFQEAAPPPTPTLDDDASMGDDREALAEWLRQLTPPVGTWQHEALTRLLSSKRWSIVRLMPFESTSDSAGYFGIVGRRTADADGDASTENGGSSLTGVRVGLTAHMTGVATIAEAFARSVGLDERFVMALSIAARWHDAGKVDPRFQRWLHGGSPLADAASRPLAKSALVFADRVSRRRARERSGYPRGARHELSSLAILEEGTHLLETVTPADRDLVLHLVASHHGWCRPFAPVVEDREPVPVTFEHSGGSICVQSNHRYAAVGSGVAERFWTLTEKYGWFGLAWLEAILRLADHRRSALEQCGTFEDEEEEN